MDYRLEDLIDIPLLQSLQDKLNVIYSFPSAIIDNDGKVLTAVAWQDICTKFHRTNPECEKECIKSDKYIIEHLHEANPAVSYKCPHGLVDNATPIIIDGRHLGNFFTGQFFLEKPDLEFFKNQAKKYNFEEKAYLEAVEKVPIWTKEKRSQYLDFIKGFIEIIAGLGLKNLKEIEIRNTLNESELKYRSLIENSSDAIFCVNEKGEYQFANQIFASTFGKTPEYFEGKTFWDIYDKEHADMRFEATKRLFKTGESESLEVEIPLPDKTLYFWATTNPIKDDSGRVILNLTHATDITHLKQTQKELEEQITLNSNIINSARSGIIVYDTNLCYKVWNPFMEKLSGIPASQILGKHPDEMFPFLKEVGVIANLKKALYGEIIEPVDFPFEVPGIGKKGWTSDSNAPLRNSEGKIIGVIGIVHDITDRKLKEVEAENARIRAEENETKSKNFLIDLNKAQSVAKVGSWKWHIQENRLEWSDEMYKIFGLEQNSFNDNLSEIIQQRIHPDDREKVNASNSSVVEQGIPIPLEYRIVLPDNTVKIVWAEAGELIKDKDLKPQVLTGVVQDITERKQIENRLSINETRHTSMISNISDVIGIIGTDGIMKYKSPNIGKLFGWQPEDLVGTDGWLTVHPDDLNRIQKEFQVLLEVDNSVKTVEYKYLCKDGSYKPIELTANNLVNDPIIGGILTNYHDISERKKLEEGLIHSHNLFQYIIEHNRSAIAVHDRNLRYIYVSKRYLNDYKVKESDIIGRHHYDVFPDLPQKWRDVHQRALAGEISSAEDDIYIRDDGSVEWTRWECRPWYEPDGLIGGFIIYTEVITKQKEAEVELIKAKEKAEQSERNLKQSQEIARMGGWELDINKGTFTFTDNLLKIYHTNAEEIGGYQMTINEYSTRFVHPDDAGMVEEETRKALQTENRDFSNYVEHRIKYYDGGTGYIGVRYFIKKDEHGRTIKSFGVNQDITEKKHSEQELIKAKEKAEESDRLKSAFLANMSHEIRTPMNGILGFAELLKEPNLTGDQQQEYIRIIEKSGARMLNTVNNIVDMSKIESGLIEVNVKKFNINEKVQFAYSFFKPEAEGKGLQFFFINGLPTEEANIETDSEKVYAVLANLIKNAIKYTDSGSIVFGYNIRESKVSGDSQHAHFLEFFVKDTGIGIPKNRQAAIFERFVQADIADKRAFQGSGLGLTISKSYAEILGGKIWVNSEEEKGSTFYFTIPYNAGKEEGNSIINVVTRKVTKVRIKKLKILIAEDDETSANLLSMRVEKLSKEILFAENGIDAVEMCRSNPDIDLVLMDIQMPKMDGLEATRQIRQFNTDIIIIAQTAFAFSVDEKMAIEAGCNYYVPKPINYPVLIEFINMLFDNKN